MALKKPEQIKKKDWSISPLLMLDRVYFDPVDKAIYGDMQFSFEEAHDTYTKDIERLRNQAINSIVYAREENDENVIYELLNTNPRDGKNCVCEIVTAKENLTDDFLKAVKEHYSEDIKINPVPENQIYIEIPEIDESMIQYNKEKDIKEDAVYRLINAVNKLESGENHPINPTKVFDVTYTKISWHTGLDGDIYYNLDNEKGQKAIGMNEERLVRFLNNASLEDVVNLSASNRQSKRFNPDIEELIYLELTVGGSVIDRSLVYQCTKDFNKAQMDSLKTNLQTRLEEFYNDLEEDRLMSKEECLKGKESIDKDINSWLGRWPLIAGKMDFQFEEKAKNGISVKDIAKIADTTLRIHPEYRTIIKGWCKNRCEENGLNPKALPKSLISQKNL